MSRGEGSLLPSQPCGSSSGVKPRYPAAAVTKSPSIEQLKITQIDYVTGQKCEMDLTGLISGCQHAFLLEILGESPFLTASSFGGLLVFHNPSGDPAHVRRQFRMCMSLSYPHSSLRWG